MQISYFFDKQDHINFLMFNTVKDGRFTRRRLFMMLCFLIVFGILFFMQKDYFYIFLAIAFAIIFFPYSRLMYKRGFKKHTDMRFEDNICWRGTISLEENELSITSDDSKVIWKYSKVKKLYETGKYYFIGSKTEEYIIMPKDKIDTDILKSFLSELKLKTSLVPVYVKRNWFFF